MEDLAIEAAIDAFCKDMHSTRALPAPRVLSDYRYPLTSILLKPPQDDPRAPSWCEEHDVKTLSDLDRGAVDALTLSLETRRKKDGELWALATRKSYGTRLRTFLAWAENAHAKRVGIPRLRKKRKDVLSAMEGRELAEGGRTERDKLIIRVLLETGVREAAISVLRKEDIIERDKKYFFLRVRDKTGERFPPISKELYRGLCDYRDGKSGRPASRSGHLFLSDRRPSRHEDFQPIGKTGIYKAVKTAVDRAGLNPERVHPHLLRATAITRMCSQGMNPIYISEITGVSLSVIQSNYDNTSQEVIWEAAMRALDTY